MTARYIVECRRPALCETILMNGAEHTVTVPESHHVGHVRTVVIGEGDAVDNAIGRMLRDMAELAYKAGWNAAYVGEKNFARFWASTQLPQEES